MNGRDVTEVSSDRGSGWVVGSLEILGSPASLVRSIGNGVSDFFRLPYEGLTRGPGAFVSGVSRGTSSFVKHISKGEKPDVILFFLLLFLYCATTPES